MDDRGSLMKTLLTLFLLLPVLASAQGFDIYLFDMKSEFQLVKQVTNRVGYDNQPAFTHDSRALLFSSDRAEGQTDLFRYQISGGELTNLTKTPNENEYSPQAWGADHFSYVLQEGVPYQHLWQRDWKGGKAQRVLTSYVPVGYYARNDVGVLFWGRYAYSLFFEAAGSNVGPGAGESLFVINQAGRSLHPIPGSDDFSFVHKQSDWSWVIKILDPASRAITPLVSISSSNEDYCWTPDALMLTADGTKILRFKPGEDEQWQALTELSAPGLNVGGRCAVSPDGRYLALVNQRK
jgi:hypothetical protein